MAAVLCTLPCKICSRSCECCVEACNCICKPLCAALKSPFCLFVTVTTVLNVPPIVSAATVLLDYGLSDGSNCRGMLWSTVNLPLCVINVLAAWYMAYTIGRGQSNPSNFETSTGRLMHLLCYDNWIALYIVVVAGFCVWQGMGSAWIAADVTNQSCPGTVTQSWAYALGCGWMYIAVGGTALCCSACCASCQEGRGNHNAATPQEFYVSPEQRMMEEGKINSQQEIPVVQAVLVNEHNAPLPGSASAPPMYQAQAAVPPTERGRNPISSMMQSIKQGNLGNAKVW